MTIHIGSPVTLSDANLRAMSAAGPKFGDDRLPYRFWAKINLDFGTGCWPWTACRDGDGYGLMFWKGRSRKVHRLAWTELLGDLPAHTPTGPQLDHLCRRRECANPAHCELVTQRVNTARAAGMTAAAVRARTVTGMCIRGHADWDMKQQACRECARMRGRKNSAATHAAIRDAARALGLSQNQYKAQYGQSRRLAESLLRSASQEAS